MKHIVVLFTFLQLTDVCVAQERQSLCVWGALGFGVSSFAFTGGHWGLSGNLGLAARYDYFTLKYKRNVVSQFAVLGFQEHVKSHEFLFGYAFGLFPRTEANRTSSDVRLGLSGGIGEIQYFSRGRLLSSAAFDDEYETITNSGPSIPLEIELECRFGNYVGVALTTFASISEFHPVFGGNLCLRLGFL